MIPHRCGCFPFPPFRRGGDFPHRVPVWYAISTRMENDVSYMVFSTVATGDDDHAENAVGNPCAATFPSRLLSCRKKEKGRATNPTRSEKRERRRRKKTVEEKEGVRRWKVCNTQAMARTDKKSPRAAVASAATPRIAEAPSEKKKKKKGLEEEKGGDPLPLPHGGHACPPPSPPPPPSPVDTILLPFCSTLLLATPISPFATRVDWKVQQTFLLLLLLLLLLLFPLLLLWV